MTRRYCAMTAILLLMAFCLSAQEVRDSLAASIVVSGKTVTAEPGGYSVDSEKIQQIVSPIGEADMVKFIQTLPGIATGAEGSSAIYARGGNLGNNRISLDGIPIYGSSHLFGFSSVLPQSIIESTDFHIGGFMGDDGNLTASHVRMSSKNVVASRAGGNASLSNFLASAFISTPIVKDKLSFIGSFRISPLGIEYKMVKNLIRKYQSQIDNFSATVYDVFGKLKYQLSDKQSLSLWVFNSKDSYAYDIGTSGLSRDGLNWSNLVGNLQYDAIMHNGYTLKASLSYNGNVSGQSQIKYLASSANKLEMRNILREVKLSAISSKRLSMPLSIQFGASVAYDFYNPGTSRFYSGDENNPAKNNPFTNNGTGTLLSSLHVQAEWKKENAYLFRMAVRANGYLYPYGNTTRFMFRPEASVLGRINVTRLIAIELTADCRTQFLHSLEGIPMGWSLDMIVPSDNRYKPESALQGYFGILTNFGLHRFSIGGYAKKMYGIISYKNAADFFSTAASDWRNNIEQGSGTSFGGEFLYEVSTERLSGRLAYTISKTDRHFENLNHGRPFPAKFDRRHILNASFSYAIFRNQTLGLNVNTFFTYQSGHWETIANCLMPGWNFIEDTVTPVMYVSAINDTRMPDYIRWDNSLSLEIKRPRCRHNINLGVYNTLNRHNPSFIVYNNEKERWETLSLIPIMPSLYYSIAF